MSKTSHRATDLARVSNCFSKQFKDFKAQGKKVNAPLRGGYLYFYSVTRPIFRHATPSATVKVDFKLVRKGTTKTRNYRLVIPEEYVDSFFLGVITEPSIIEYVLFLTQMIEDVSQNTYISDEEREARVNKLYRQVTPFICGRKKSARKFFSEV